MKEYLLSFLIFLPLVGVLLICYINSEKKNLIRFITIGISLITFLLSLYIYTNFNENIEDFQFYSSYEWIPSFGVSYTIGIDGISLMLIMITTLLTPIALIASWTSVEKSIKSFNVMILMLETGMLGVFCALDLFLFYVFWEVILIPMYFIIGIWGGENKIYASVKFFIYTMFGSLIMLVAIILLINNVATITGGPLSANLLVLYDYSPDIANDIQLLMFLAFALSFAIKVPIFPLHTWLPDAHTEAPTAGSVILAGVLLKMGTYGLIRFCVMLFPYATIYFAPFISLLAVIGIVYGALVSMVQTDIKRLVAYSSVSHMGFVVLGIFALNQESLQGSTIQMINHGLSTGALFLLVGMIYERRHTRKIGDFGGLAKKVPIYATIFMIIMFSSIGLPGLNGFVGEFLILLGSFKSSFLDNNLYTIISTSGVILSAVYMMFVYQRIFFGKLENELNQNLKDLNKREIGIMIPIIIFIVWIGIFPSTFLSKTNKSVKIVIDRMEYFDKFYKEQNISKMNLEKIIK
jgi:NADH-quinone oxidoreductase subunit M